MNHQTNPAISTLNNLTETLNTLSTSLKSIAPVSNENTQLITYALVATAMVGIFVYHYIKEQEKLT